MSPSETEGPSLLCHFHHSECLLINTGKQLLVQLYSLDHLQGRLHLHPSPSIQRQHKEQLATNSHCSFGDTHPWGNRLWVLTACGRVTPHTQCWVMGEHLPLLPVHNSTEMLFKWIWGFSHGPGLTSAETLFIKTTLSKTLAWHEKGQDSDIKHMKSVWKLPALVWPWNICQGGRGHTPGYSSGGLILLPSCCCPDQTTRELQQISVAIIFRKEKKKTNPNLHGTLNTAAQNCWALFETFVGLKQIKII